MPQSTSCLGATTVARRGTILLAEADTVVRKALRRTLQNSGYCLLETNTGEEAMDLCKRHTGPIDLFLSDLSLPGLRGPKLGTDGDEGPALDANHFSDR